MCWPGRISFSIHLPKLWNVQFTEAEIKELKYAALLYDLGKVGVRESVLVKGKKLSAGSLENIRYPIPLTRRNDIFSPESPMRDAQPYLPPVHHDSLLPASPGRAKQNYYSAVQSREARRENMPQM